MSNAASSGSAGVPYDDCASIDDCVSGVIVVAGKSQRAGAVFGKGAAATDHPAEGLITVRAEEERSIVGNGAGVIATAE